MSKLRFAVIGTGHLGRIHAKLLGQVDGAQLVAVSDPNEPARQQVADQHDVPAYANYRDCIESIDAAVVASPTDTHADVVGDLLRAGKHVFVEKPLTIDREDARRLALLASARRSTLQVGHVERFNPAFTALGNLGVDVKYVEAVRASSFPGRCLDVGVVMDLMIHDLDLVLSFTDAAVRSVSSSGLSVISDHEDLAEARIEFECGLVACLKASRISPAPARQMQVYGANGYADIDFGGPSLSVVRPSETVSNRSFDLFAETDNPLDYSGRLFSERLCCETLDLEPRNAILDELHDFVISVQTGMAPTVDGAAGAYAVDVAQRVLESIEQRCWYADATESETGPHAVRRERIENATRRRAA
ncbi:MAG: Gfo/Idh/MocA family oxidoreductase [Planctomycetota bacterium]